MSRRKILAAATAAIAVAGLAQVAPATGADRTQRQLSGVETSEKYVGSALGNGLGRLLAQSGTLGARAKIGGSGLRVDQASTAIFDSAGRVMVDLTPRAGVDRAGFRRQATALGLQVTATDHDLGTLEGYTPLSAVTDLAGLEGTGTIAQVVRPHTYAGATTSQGVAFQRVDKLLDQGIDGAGITVGVLSDSYDTATYDHAGNPLTVHAADDVASGDLPGVGNPENSQPVVVIEDGSDPDYDTDEGRGMLQIVHDLAPQAKLCFASASDGLVGFADNIRALADTSGPCAADVIVDDIGYGDESPFSDNVISDAVNDVTAAGVTYLSAAGNASDHQAWAAPVHLVSKSAGVKGTNLDFRGVDPELYAGGLEDMDGSAGVDIAQDIALDPASGLGLLVQWNDPFDLDGADIGDPYFDVTGEVTDVDPAPSFEFTPTADQLGKEVLVTTDAIPSGETDLILDLVKPDGTEVGPVDTITSPETLATELDQEGTYTLRVSAFHGDTGDFTLDVRPVLAPSTVTTDFNALLFTPKGQYMGTLGDDNTLTGRPDELLSIGGFSKFQLVLARRTTGPTAVTRMSYTIQGAGYVAEHYRPTDVGIVGHPAAAGAIAVAAYDPFRSFLPESYTSVGGRMPFYFDSAGNAYADPQVRQKPDVASTDGVNTTFFVADASDDADSFPNFYGTSAAAPHAAAIAALMLEKAGGPGSLTPAEVKGRMQSSTFTHDLDPFRSGGKKRGLSVTAAGAGSYEYNLTPGSLADSKFFRVSYQGHVPLRSITFHGRSASPTSADGIVFDKRSLGRPGNYAAGGFPFTVGATSGGLHAGQVSARLHGEVRKLDGRFRNLKIRFSQGLHHGQALRFGIDRDRLESASADDNGADELGGATLIPSGKVLRGGLRFTAVRADGKVIHGHLVNRLGAGWTAVDGYGLVNAEKAVLGNG